jgi:hypothetical protein
MLGLCEALVVGYCPTNKAGNPYSMQSPNLPVSYSLASLTRQPILGSILFGWP